MSWSVNPISVRVRAIFVLACTRDAVENSRAIGVGFAGVQCTRGPRSKARGSLQFWLCLKNVAGSTSCYTAPAAEVGMQAPGGTVSGYGSVMIWARLPRQDALRQSPARTERGQKKLTTRARATVG